MKLSPPLWSMAEADDHRRMNVSQVLSRLKHTTVSSLRGSLQNYPNKLLTNCVLEAYYLFNMS